LKETIDLLDYTPNKTNRSLSRHSAAMATKHHYPVSLHLRVAPSWAPTRSPINIPS
jgi:hypothetical protein